MPPFTRIVSSTSPVEPVRGVYHGHAAVYANGQMRFGLPENLANMLPSGVRVESFGDDTWKLSTDHGVGPRVGRRKMRIGERTLNAPRRMETPPPFGISPAEYRVIDGEILVSVPLETRSALKIVPSRARAKVVTTGVTGSSSNFDQMRECLAIIRRIEVDTPFRLVVDKESGVWRFVASVE